MTHSKPDNEYVNGTQGQSLGQLEAVSERTTVTLRNEPDVALAAADLFADVRADAIDEQAIAGADASTAVKLSAAAEQFRNG